MSKQGTNHVHIWNTLPYMIVCLFIYAPAVNLRPTSQPANGKCTGSHILRPLSGDRVLCMLFICRWTAALPVPISFVAILKAAETGRLWDVPDPDDREYLQQRWRRADSAAKETTVWPVLIVIIDERWWCAKCEVWGGVSSVFSATVYPIPTRKFEYYGIYIVAHMVRG